MTRKNAGFFAVLAISGALMTPAMAGPFEDGSAAYRQGDYARALALWRPLADSNPEVEDDIGTLYLEGKGVPQNTAEAVRWISRAAANGSPSAQNNLGALYRDGNGVPRDFHKAFIFFTAAATRGNAGGQLNLGRMYQMGQGIPADTHRAYMWLDIAVAEGVRNAEVPRAEVRAVMTATDFAAARTLEQRCRKSDFKNCG